MSPTNHGAIIGVLEDLQKEYTKTFTLFHPAMSEVIEKQQLRKANGPEITFIITPDGPGTITPILNGDELIPSTSRENSVKGRATSGTAVYQYTISEEDIKLLTGKSDVVQLLKDYPQRAMVEFRQNLARQFVMGDVADMITMPTINGERTYQPRQGYPTQPGILQHVPKMAQNAVVHNVQLNSIPNWHNQYREISSFRTDGTKQFRRLLRECAQQGDHESGIDIVLMDNETFDHYVDFNDDRLIFINEPGTDKNKQSAVRQGTQFMAGGTKFVADPFIRIDQMTGNGTAGVAYGLNLDAWHFFTHAGNLPSVKLDEGWFELRPPQQLQQQLAYQFISVLTFGAYCNDLRTQFTATGGARE